MKYTLTYRNKQGVEARLDIITHGIYSQTEIIEGTDTPFILNYKREKNDKDGYIISSSADISIYESGTFNIDELKTSNETDIKVEYYIDNVLTWVGFVVPDFFSRVIGAPAVVNMVASDRLGSLKGQTLSNLPATITLSSLVSSCLAKTGLSLPVNLKADFTSVAGNENIFSSKVLSQRFTDTKGRNISCYDILRSILVATNSIVVQRNGEWYVANKFQVEQEMVLPEQQYIDFNEVTVGARRQIVPVASSVGVYHEFGGERRHPQNFDFSEELAGWTAVNGFDGEVKNKEIIEFTRGETIEPVYGVNDTMPYLLITNTKPENRLMYGEDGWNFEDAPYLKSTFPVISLNESIVNITFDAGLIGSNSSLYYFLVIAKNRNDATDIYALNKRGLFTEYDFHSDDFAISKVLEGEKYYTPVTGVKNIVGKFEAENVKDYDIELRIYPATALRFNGDVIVGVNYASIMFNNETEIPKGNIYKTTQGDSFTKQHDTDTSVIGDYLTSGLNGYFYPYPMDDTSSLLTSSGDLTTRWMAPGITEELPLLQHVTRQRSRMFSVAHDLLSAEINSDILDPLAIFRDCSGKRYVLVSGSQDFLRGVINVEIEEIAYDLEIWKRDYIYSYFREGEEGVSSVGGISEAAPGGGGGGMTPEQLELLNEALKDIITSTDETKEFTDDNLLSSLRVLKEISDAINEIIITSTDTTTLTDDNVLSSLRVLKEISDAFDEAIITSTDETTEFTDEKILSSLRVLKEILDNNEYLRTQFLSKVYEDTAQKIITFLEGIKFGNYIPGLLGSGGRIDGNGAAELRSLRLWESLEVPELRYNRIRVYTGVDWQTFGGGIIESVEIDTDEYGNELQSGIITLKLEDGEFGAIDVDDLCQGIYHNFDGENDTESEDQRNGNFHIQGFKTSYFRITEILDTSTNGQFRYVLRGVSERWNQLNHPKPFMHFACYANPSNPDRQACSYSTTEYSIRLRNMTTWEYGENNIFGIEGKLDGFSLGGTNFTGSGQVIGNGYFYGHLQQIFNAPYELIIENGGDNFLAFGESMDITCKVMKGLNDVTNEVETWQVTRESGNQAEDDAWNIAHQDFAGQITLQHTQSYSDLGEGISTLFRFVASSGSETAIMNLTI